MHCNQLCPWCEPWRSQCRWISSGINANELNCGSVQMQDSCVILANALCNQHVYSHWRKSHIQLVLYANNGQALEALRCIGSAGAICSEIHANAFSYTMKHMLLHSSQINKSIQSAGKQFSAQLILHRKVVCMCNQWSDRGGRSNVIILSTVESASESNTIWSTLNANAITTTAESCGVITNTPWLKTIIIIK